MAKAKNEAFDVLSRHFDNNAPAIWRWLDDEGSMARDEGLTARDNIESISVLYEQVSRMPVWPFNTRIIARFVGYMLVAIVPILLQRFSGL